MIAGVRFLPLIKATLFLIGNMSEGVELGPCFGVECDLLRYQNIVLFY